MEKEIIELAQLVGENIKEIDYERVKIRLTDSEVSLAQHVVPKSIIYAENGRIASAKRITSVGYRIRQIYAVREDYTKIEIWVVGEMITSGQLALIAMGVPTQNSRGIYFINLG